MNRLAAILLWSVIAAAFIGPGTVTTAASAGAGHGLTLLWTLVFSTVACLLLQEASARLTVVSGRTLGQSLRHRYPAGLKGGLTLILVLGAILLGCAAYEAGNILGGAAGAMLVTGWSATWLAVVAGGIAGILLWFQAPKQIARLLSLVVAVMAYISMGISLLEHLIFTFPELLLVVLALVLLAGRYTGYRLSELKRFAPLVKS